MADKMHLPHNIEWHAQCNPVRVGRRRYLARIVRVVARRLVVAGIVQRIRGDPLLEGRELQVQLVHGLLPIGNRLTKLRDRSGCGTRLDGADPDRVAAPGASLPGFSSAGVQASIG